MNKLLAAVPVGKYGAGKVLQNGELEKLKICQRDYEASHLRVCQHRATLVTPSVHRQNCSICGSHAREDSHGKLEFGVTNVSLFGPGSFGMVRVLPVGWAKCAEHCT